MSSSPSRTHAGGDSPFDAIPRALLEDILGRLTWRDAARAASVCRDWNAIIDAEHDPVPTWTGAFVERDVAHPLREEVREDVAGIVRRFEASARPDVCVFFASDAYATARHGARVGREGEAVDAEFIGAQFAERLPASCAIVGGVARGVIGSDTASGECREFEREPALVACLIHLPRDRLRVRTWPAHTIRRTPEHSHETGSNNPIDDPRYIKSADDWMAHRAPEFPEYDSDGEPIERDPDQLVAQSSLILNAEPFSSLDEDGNAFDELANMPREKCGDAKRCALGGLLGIEDPSAGAGGSRGGAAAAFFEYETASEAPRSTFVRPGLTARHKRAVMGPHGAVLRRTDAAWHPSARQNPAAREVREKELDLIFAEDRDVASLYIDACVGGDYGLHPVVSRGAAPVGPALLLCGDREVDPLEFPRELDVLRRFRPCDERTGAPLDPDAPELDAQTALRAMAIGAGQRRHFWLGVRDKRHVASGDERYDMANIVGLDPVTDGLVIEKKGRADAALEAGAVVRFFEQSAAKSRAEIRDAARAIGARLEAPPLGAFAAVCTGRGARFHGGEKDAEVRALREGCGGGRDEAPIPIIGWFAGGEYGPAPSAERAGEDIARGLIQGFTGVFGILAPVKEEDIDEAFSRV